MNRALKSALHELSKEGITLDAIADLEHILTLDKLALQISTPEDPPGERGLLQREITIGNLRLRRISLGAQRFLVDVVAEWFPGDVRTQDLAYVYTMDHTDNPERLWALQHDRRAFLKALRRWERSIGVTYEELKAKVATFVEQEGRKATKPNARSYLDAINLLDNWRKLPEPYRTEAEAAAVAWQVETDSEQQPFGWMIEMLVKDYGRTAEDWLWRTPYTDIDLILHNRSERQNAEQRALHGAQDDRFQRAHYAFRSYVDLVKKLKKGVKL